MNSTSLAKLVKGIGSLVHLLGILAGASAVYNAWSLFGRIIRNAYTEVTWGDLIYRAVLCAVLVWGGLALAKVAERLNAGGDPERAAAAESERAEADRLSREIHVPRRRNND